MMFVKNLLLGLLVITSLVMAANSAHAFNPDEVLKDPVLEKRARGLSAGLRCLVCQNQSIDDSNATLARDLRLLVRERLTEGDSDTQVLDYVVARYGQFVLLKPSINPRTYILWFAPIGLLLIGAFGIFIVMRRRVALTKAGGVVALSKEEETALEKLLDK